MYSKNSTLIATKCILNFVDRQYEKAFFSIKLICAVYLFVKLLQFTLNSPSALQPIRGFQIGPSKKKEKKASACKYYSSLLSKTYKQENVSIQAL